MNEYVYRGKVDTTIWRWNMYMKGNDTQKDGNNR